MLIINSFRAQKMKFAIKNFVSKCNQIRNFLRIWSHLLKKYLVENFILCVLIYIYIYICIYIYMYNIYNIYILYIFYIYNIYIYICIYIYIYIYVTKTKMREYRILTHIIWLLYVTNLYSQRYLGKTKRRLIFDPNHPSFGPSDFGYVIRAYYYIMNQTRGNIVGKPWLLRPQWPSAELTLGLRTIETSYRMFISCN